MLKIREFINELKLLGTNFSPYFKWIIKLLQIPWNMQRKDKKETTYISLKEEKNLVSLKIEDDGVGLGFDFNTTTTDTLTPQRFFIKWAAKRRD